MIDSARMIHSRLVNTLFHLKRIKFDAFFSLAQFRNWSFEFSTYIKDLNACRNDSKNEKPPNHTININNLSELCYLNAYTLWPQITMRIAAHSEYITLIHTWVFDGKCIIITTKWRNGKNSFQFSVSFLHMPAYRQETMVW